MAKGDTQRQKASKAKIVLLDSNIIIYLSQQTHPEIKELIKSKDVYVSDITKIEVLGYEKISSNEMTWFEKLFSKIESLSISEPIVKQTIKLKQHKKISLGDAIIAATALVYKIPLVTHNTKDFKWIENLTLIDPIKPNNKE